MAAEARALAEVLDLRSPRWSVEADLIDAAIRLSANGSKYNAPQAILRRARELAAARSGRTERPTIADLRAALSGSPEQRIGVLVRLLISEMEDAHTKGSDPEGQGGGSHDPPSGLVGHDD